MNKYIALGLLVFLMVVGGVFWLLIKPVSKTPTQSVNNQTNSQQSENKKAIVKKDLAPEVAPERFPSNIPIENGAKITQNYNATAPDGRFQATRAFETTLTLAQNLALYKDFLVKDGWKIETSLDMENYKMILGSKANAQLQISIDNNATIGMKTVNISYTESPAKK